MVARAQRAKPVVPLQQRRVGQVRQDEQGDSISGAVNRLVDSPLANAILIETTLKFGLNNVSHGLGRAPRWVWASVTYSDVVVTLAQQENPFPMRSLYLWLEGAPEIAVALLVI